MREQAVVALLQVQPGDLLDSLQTAVQRGSVHAKGISRGRHVAAVLEQALERLDELRRAAMMGERDDRRGRLRASGAVPQRGDQRPAAEPVVGGDRPLAGVRAERGDGRLAQRLGRVGEAGEGRAHAAGGAGLGQRPDAGGWGRARAARRRRRRSRHGECAGDRARRRRPRSRRRRSAASATSPRARTPGRAASAWSWSRVRRSRSSASRCLRHRLSATSWPPRCSAPRSASVSGLSPTITHRKPSRTSPWRIGRQPRRIIPSSSLRGTSTRSRARWSPSPSSHATTSGAVSRVRIDERRTASASSGWMLCASSRQRRSSTEIGRRISASRSSTISCRSATVPNPTMRSDGRRGRGRGDQRARGRLRAAAPRGEGARAGGGRRRRGAVGRTGADLPHRPRRPAAVRARAGGARALARVGGGVGRGPAAGRRGPRGGGRRARGGGRRARDGGRRAAKAATGPRRRRRA